MWNHHFWFWKKDNWERNTSEFTRKIVGKENIILVIEDTNGNKFGHYLSQEIKRAWDFVYDEKAFVFSLKSNGRLDGMMKFPIRNKSQAFEVYDETTDWLLTIGQGGPGLNDDINLMKSDCLHSNPRCGCKQSSYDYNGIQNALCGSMNFMPKKFVVIQMIKEE